MVIWKSGGQVENGDIASLQVKKQEGLCMLACRGTDADEVTGLLLSTECVLGGLICV